MIRLLILTAILTACSPPVICLAPDAAVAPAPEPSGKSTLALANATTNTVAVNVAFGADSVFLPAAWTACAATGPLTCTLALPAASTATVALGGAYFNATVAFDLPVGCGATKAELNLNNPAWYDTGDVSLVDGFNVNLQVQFGSVLLGPTLGANGNAAVLGVFPLGCDICAARFNPPCGQSKGTQGCKAGTQYAPVPPCQVQGLVKGGGTAVVVSVLP